MEKRAWVSPEINNWENENIENGPDFAVDGGAKSYF